MPHDDDDLAGTVRAAAMIDPTKALPQCAPDCSRSDAKLYRCARGLLADWLVVAYKIQVDLSHEKNNECAHDAHMRAPQLLLQLQLLQSPCLQCMMLTQYTRERGQQYRGGSLTKAASAMKLDRLKT